MWLTVPSTLGRRNLETQLISKVMPPIIHTNLEKLSVHRKQGFLKTLFKPGVCENAAFRCSVDGNNLKTEFFENNDVIIITGALLWVLSTNR